MLAGKLDKLLKTENQKQINTILYLIVIKFAVLQVGRAGDGAHTGVSVVVRVLTHTVWETLL